MDSSANKPWLTRLAALLPLAFIGCAAEFPESTEPIEREQSGTQEIRGLSSAISAEVTSQAEILGRMRLGTAKELTTSYATMRWDGALACSGTMIGPNVMITAAHCGEGAGTATFLLYNSSSLSNTAHIDEAFSCTMLLNSWPETDLSLWYCLPNVWGESAGDKYGYLDFDLAFTSSNSVNVAASRSKVTVGAPVTSYWWNPVGALPSEMLRSTGTLRRVNDPGWFNPTPPDWSSNLDQCQSDDDLPIAINADIYSNPGCSGSALITIPSYPGLKGRVLGGPTSIAFSESRDRSLLSAIEYLQRAIIQTPNAQACGFGPVMINGPFIQANWGLNATNFTGYVDANNNGVFDLQEQLEAVEGEHRRSVYYTNFDSPRSNLLWNVNASSGDGMRTDLGQLRSTSSSGMSATHTRLHLKPNTSYHVGLVGNSQQSTGIAFGDGANLDFALVGPFTGSQSAILNSKSGTFSVISSGGSSAGIDELSIVEMGTTMDFDTADARALWRHARMLPLGPDSQTRQDWAMMVSYPTLQPYTTLQSNHLPFRPGKNRICFDYRSNPLEAPPANAQWLVGFTTAATDPAPASMIQLPHSNSWRRYCIQHNAASANTWMHFGMLFGNPSTGSYLVDNISVESGDVPLVGDFDSDGQLDDIGVWRPSDGNWFATRKDGSVIFSGIQWGLLGDTPIVGDFDSDGFVDDLGIFRPPSDPNGSSAGKWYAKRTDNSVIFGDRELGALGDVPLVGDFDSDGRRDDIAVWTPATGMWRAKNESNVLLFTIPWGGRGDVPLVGDFDADGRFDDLGVWRAVNGNWYAKRTDNSIIFFDRQWGLAGDIPRVGDFDSDGLVDDIGVFRPSTGAWFARRNDDVWLFGDVVWGIGGDIPLVADYDSDGAFDDLGFWRPTDATWWARRTDGSVVVNNLQWGAPYGQ